MLHGSNLLIEFTRHAVEFLEGVETYLPSSLRQPQHVARILNWTDQCFNDLFSACHEDVINGSYTHLNVGSCFYLLHERHTKGPSLDYLRQELMLLGSRVPPAVPSNQVASPSMAPPARMAAPTRNVIPQHLYRHLPKVDGKQVCLKHMTVQGCSLSKCPRKHVIVPKLHAKVREFICDVAYGGGPCAELPKE